MLLKNPIDVEKYNTLDEKQKESLNEYLADPKDPSKGLKENSEKALKQQRSDLIQGAKHMRSHDHRGFLHENGILQELRWTHKRNEKKLSVESQELAAVKKEVDRYNARIEKAHATLEQRRAGREAAQKFLKSLGNINTDKVRPTTVLPTNNQQTKEHQI